jgi:serine/threonine protein kinase
MPTSGALPRPGEQVGRIEINADGIPSIDGRRIPVRDIFIEKVIGSGANGIVFRGRHTILDRPMAVKFWLTLRPTDLRDKFRQGMAEAKKAAAAQSPHIIPIYDAGEAGGLFYATMEFFEGKPMARWLRSHMLRAPLRPGNKKDDLNLFPRWTFARLFLAALKNAHAKNLLHGDLHTGNLLVGETFRNDNYMPAFYDRDFRIIDFGTSLFSNARPSQRHWRVLEETIDQIAQPLRIEPIWGRWRPKNPKSATEWHNWFASYLAYLPLVILELVNPEPQRREMKMRCNIEFAGADEKPILVTLTQEARDFINGLLSAGQLQSEDTKWFEEFGIRRSFWSGPPSDNQRHSGRWVLPLEPPK